MTPIDAQGAYVPHYRDDTDTVHLFAVMKHNAAPALCYVRAREIDDNALLYDSHPLMPLSGTEPSPWPLPALQLYVEEGDLDAAQALARAVAGEHGFSFPETFPPLQNPSPQTDVGGIDLER